jgi:hypothetical protein
MSAVGVRLLCSDLLWFFFVGAKLFNLLAVVLLRLKKIGSNFRGAICHQMESGEVWFGNQDSEQVLTVVR